MSTPTGNQQSRVTVTNRNTGFMLGNPNGSLPPRPLVLWDLPMNPGRERAIYRDVMSQDISKLHERVRLYIASAPEPENNDLEFGDYDDYDEYDEPE